MKKPILIFILILGFSLQWHNGNLHLSDNIPETIAWGSEGRDDDWGDDDWDDWDDWDWDDDWGWGDDNDDDHKCVICGASADRGSICWDCQTGEGDDSGHGDDDNCHWCGENPCVCHDDNNDDDNCCYLCGADPCVCFDDSGDDGGGGQGSGDGEVACEGEVCPICNKFRSISQGEKCEMCLGHTIDCMGIIDGKAYTRTNCEGKIVCVDGNAGMFNNQMPNIAKKTFKRVVGLMNSNCLRASLLNNLNPNYGLDIQLGNAGSGGLAGFNPCNYSVIFASEQDINIHAITAELFHAYQEQHLNGKLTQIINSSDKKGGSNIEFEEKAMIMFVESFSFGNLATFPETQKLLLWVIDFIETHNFSSELTLTEEEKQSWFEALEVFQKYHEQDDPNSLYGKPIDYNMLPTALLSLLSKSNCVAP